MTSKTIIVHDTFLYKGGGERLILMMAKKLKSDIASGFFSNGSFDLKKEGFTGEMISVSSEVYKNGFRHIKLKLAFMFKTKFLKNYDTVIFSGDCISAVRNSPKSQKKIYYCHTPPRYLYDLYDEYLAKVPKLQKPIFRVLVRLFRKMYERDIKKMDLVLTNSKNTQKRIKEFLGIDSIVLYPPVDLDKFKFIGIGDYYLSFARLSEAKRVNKIVEAFNKLKNQKLIITYGVNDPRKDEIFELAKDNPNIIFKTGVSDSELVELIGNAIATIYIPVDEDFGMSPIESMAAGKLVVGVDDGGLKETIIDGKTGVLIHKDVNISELIDAITSIDKEKSLSARGDCESRARDFSLKVFEDRLVELVGQT